MSLCINKVTIIMEIGTIVWASIVTILISGILYKKLYKRKRERCIKCNEPRYYYTNDVCNICLYYESLANKKSE